MAETQKYVHEWCKTTFSQFAGLQGRTTALPEEAVELALAEGVNPEDIRRIVEVPIVKEAQCARFYDLGDANPPLPDVGGEIADALICVYACAEEAGYDARKELDEKMALNRSRPAEYYAEKTARKEELGYVLPESGQKV